MARKKDAAPRFEHHTAGFLEHPDGGFGEYVVAPQSETFVRDGRTFVKDAFLETYRKRHVGDSNA